MQDADGARLDVPHSPVRVEQLARRVGQPQGHRVDGEVAPGEVVLDGGRLYARQGAGPRVGLAAGAGDVDAEAVAAQRGGPEAGVPHDAIAGSGQAAGEDGGVALGCQVQV